MGQHLRGHETDAVSFSLSGLHEARCINCGPTISINLPESLQHQGSDGGRGQIHEPGQPPIGHVGGVLGCIDHLAVADTNEGVDDVHGRRLFHLRN